jgi:hypothetical protein
MSNQPDRIVHRNGQPIRISEQELDGYLEAAFRSATEIALHRLGVENASEIDNIDCGGEFGSEQIIACVRLKDGRETSVSAPIWPDKTTN